MPTQILTTDFTDNELVNLRTPALEAAKRACSDKITFFQNEINTGHSSASHIENLLLFTSEFVKWVPIVRAAKKRDIENEDFYFSRTGLQG